MLDRFDAEKAVEAILYIVSRISEPTLHKVAKVLYFADRKHIDRYGRFITGDQYVAMKNGPVPSATYDILKYIRGDNVPCRFDHARALIFVHGRYNLSVDRDADTDYFSDSDIECLDESIAENGSLSFSELTKKSHDAVYDSADRDDFIKLDAFIAHSSSPDSLREYVSNPMP